MVTGQLAVIKNSCLTQATTAAHVHLLNTAQTNNVKE